MCEQSKKYGGVEFKLIGFNKLFDLREIPGYLGKITLYCDIQPEYYIDGEAVESDFQFVAELEDGRESVCVRKSLPAELKVTANIKIRRVNFDIDGVISKLVTSPESEGVWVYKNDSVDFEPGNHKAIITIYPEQGEPFEFKREFIVNSLCLAEVKVNEQVLEEGMAPLVAIGGDGETCAQIVNDLYVELFANSFTGKLGDTQNWITSAEATLGGHIHSLSKTSSNSNSWKVNAKNIELPPGTHRAVVTVTTADSKTRSFERSFKIQEACPEVSIIVNGKQLNDTDTKILGIAGDCQILNIPHDISIEPIVPPTPGVRYWKYEGMSASSPIPPLGGGAPATSATLLTFVGTAQRGVDGAVSATASFSTSQGSKGIKETFHGNLKIYECPKITLSTSVGTHTQTRDCKGNFEEQRAEISIDAELELLRDENGNPLIGSLGVSGTFPLTGEVTESETSISFRGTAEELEGSKPPRVYDVQATAYLIGGETLKEDTSFSIELDRVRKPCDKDKDKDEEEEDPPPPPCVGCRGAGSWGDPHLKTFDGLGYSFQAVGEFTLAESLDGSLVVQTRQLPAGSRVSLNYAVAAQVGDDRIAVYHGEPVPLWINGKPANLSDKRYYGLPAGGRIYLNESDGVHDSNVYNIYWPPNAAGQSARLEISVLSGHINIYNFELPSQYRGKIRGLLGNFNDDLNDEISTREGRAFAQPVEFDALYGEYAESWRVTDETSLFSYVDGESTLTFTDRSFPDRPISVADLSPVVRREAEATCRAAGVTDESVLEGCTLDVAITADETFAVSAAPALPSEQPLEVDMPVFEDRTLIFSGRVVNALNEDAGLPEVEVKVAAPGHILRDECVTHTDSLGDYRCRVTLVDGNPFNATVTASGYGPLNTFEVAVTDADLPGLGGTKAYGIASLQLNPATLRLTGRIVGREGQAATGATVSVSGPADQASTQTDSSGRYELYLAVPDKNLTGSLNYSVTYKQPLASDEVYTSQTFRAVNGTVTDVSRIISLNIEAKPALSYVNLFGKVNNTTDVVVPLDDLTLVVRAKDGAAHLGELCRTEVGRLGSYNCEGLYLPYIPFLPVSYELLYGDERVTEEEQTSHPLMLHNGSSTPLKLAYNMSVTPTLLQLEFAVSDQIGVPVEGATISVLVPHKMEVITNQEGSGTTLFYLPFGSSIGDVHYHVSYNGAGQNILLDDQVLSYSANKGELVTLSAPITLPLTLSARDLVFTGYVTPVWSSNFVLDDYTVAISTTEFGDLCSAVVVPDETDYTCTARVASSEDFDVTYSISGPWGSHEITATVPVKTFSSPEPFTQPLKIPLAGIELSGMVSDDLGKALENVEVQISGAHNMLLATMSDGSYSTQFTVADPSNPLNLEVSVRYGEHNLTERATLDVVANENTLTKATQDVTFTKRLVQLSGQLLYEDESRPVANSNVTFYEQDKVLCTVVTDNTGTFACPAQVYERGGNLELTYSVETDSGDTVTLPLSVPLPAAGGRSGDDLRLSVPRSGVVLRGTIIDEAGQPIEGANVKASTNDQVDPVRTGIDGSYQFSFKTPETASMLVELVVEDGLAIKTDSVTIDLSTGGLIEQTHDITLSSHLQFVLDAGALNSLNAKLWVPADPPLLVDRDDRGSRTAWPYTTGVRGSWAGFNPNVTTIHQRLDEGAYHYAIYNSSSSELAGSGATVTISNRQGVITTVDVPSSGTGDWWYVATVDAATGEVNVVNALLHTFDESALQGESLPRVVRLEGAVTEAGQEPWSPYYVDVALPGGSWSSRICRTSTDAQGRYDCSWITSNHETFDLEVTAEGDGGEQVQTRTVPASDEGTSITQDFTFSTTNVRLRGRVTDYLGNGIPDISVRVSGDFWDRVETDAEGYYTFEEVFADERESVEVQFRVLKDTTVERTVYINLEPGTINEHVENFETAATLVLRGKVTDENGDAFEAPSDYFAAATMNIEGDLNESVSIHWLDGTYELTYDLTESWDSLTLYLHPSFYDGRSGYEDPGFNYEPRVVTIDLTEGGLTEHTEDFVISSYALTVKGRVTDESGLGIPDTLVSSSDLAGFPNSLNGETFTDAEGYYSLDYDLYGDWSEVLLNLRIGEGLDALDRRVVVALQASGTVEHIENIQLQNELLGLAEWSTETFGYNLALGPDGKLYISNGNTTVAVEEGSEIWTADVEAFEVAVGADGTVYGSGIGTAALTPTGEQKWTSDIGLFTWALAVGQDGTLYLDHEGRVVALGPDGTERWSTESNDLDFISDLALASDGALYVLTGNTLSAYTPDGTERWSRDLGGISLAIGADDEVYVNGIGTFHALDADGNDLWNASTSAPEGTWLFSRYPSAIAEDATVYVSAGDGLYAYAPDGTERWHTPLDEAITALAVGSDGVIYAGAGRALLALGSDGREQWRAEAAAEVASLAVGAKVLYVKTVDALYALNATSDGLADSPWPKSGGDNQNSRRVQP